MHRLPHLARLIGLHALLLAFLASTTAHAQPPTKRLAVLEFKGASMAADVLDAFADAVRGGAVEGLAGRGVDVMTRENMMVLLREMGKKDCTEGDCEVETARNIGADYVVSGTVTRIEGSYVVTLKLHETKGGSLLGTEMVRGKSQLGVLDLLRGQGRDLVNAKLGRFRTATVPGGTEKRIEADNDFSTGAGERVVVKFESEPNGATLLVDGELLCKETPCSKSLVPGRHEVEMQKERYARAQLTVEAKKGSVVHMTLPANFATLVIRTEPANLPVAIDGKTQALSGGALDVDPGQHEVLVNHRCYLPTGAQVVAKKGDRRDIKLVGQPRLSAIAVTAEDAKGNEVEARVVIDGTQVGTAPGTFKIPVCSKEAVVSADQGSYRKELALVEKEVSRLQVKLGSVGASAAAKNPPPAFVPLAADYALFAENNGSKPVAAMTIFDQIGPIFQVRGSDWSGSGRIDGNRGYYDWKFLDGKSGRTTFTVRGDGSLIGHVSGSGIDWTYFAAPKSKPGP